MFFDIKLLFTKKYNSSFIRKQLFLKADPLNLFSTKLFLQKKALFLPCSIFTIWKTEKKG